ALARPTRPGADAAPCPSMWYCSLSLSRQRRPDDPGVRLHLTYYFKRNGERFSSLLAAHARDGPLLDAIQKRGHLARQRFGPDDFERPHLYLPGRADRENGSILP